MSAPASKATLAAGWIVVVGGCFRTALSDYTFVTSV